MSEFWANLETSRNGDNFGDESGDEISDASVIRAVSLNTKLNAYLNNAAQTEHTGIFLDASFLWI